MGGEGRGISPPVQSKIFLRISPASHHEWLSQNMLQDHLTVSSHNNKLAYTTRQQVRW